MRLYLMAFVGDDSWLISDFHGLCHLARHDGTRGEPVRIPQYDRPRWRLYLLIERGAPHSLIALGKMHGKHVTRTQTVQDDVEVTGAQMPRKPGLPLLGSQKGALAHEKAYPAQEPDQSGAPCRSQRAGRARSA